MSDPWVALIDLSPDRRQQLEATLAAAGVRSEAVDWDHAAGPMPGLLVASLADYTRNHAHSPWLKAAGAPGVLALVAPEAPTAETLRLQLEHDLLNVIPDVICADSRWMGRVLRGLLFPAEMFDMHAYVPEPAMSKRVRVATLAEKHQLADEVAGLVRPYVAVPRQVRDVHLTINELINNAFFHSFRNPDGEEKYSPRAFSGLDEKDRVILEVAAAEGVVAVAVEDNRGTLSPQQVLKYMLRQTSGEGVFDSHGRGFYLMSNLADHLSICLAPGERTRIVSLTRAGVGGTIHTLSFFLAPSASG